jgi:hypothetical protein
LKGEWVFAHGFSFVVVADSYENDEADSSEK